MTEIRDFLSNDPEDKERYQEALDILCNKNNVDPLARMTARCSVYWFQLKFGKKTYPVVAKKMHQYLDFQEKKNPDIYHTFVKEEDSQGLSMAIRLREEILGSGNLKKYQQRF